MVTYAYTTVQHLIYLLCSKHDSGRVFDRLDGRLVSDERADVVDAIPASKGEQW